MHGRKMHIELLIGALTMIARISGILNNPRILEQYVYIRENKIVFLSLTGPDIMML